MSKTDRKRKVLVTGAAGRIGRYFSENYYNRYALRLMVKPGEPKAGDLRELGEIVEADLNDPAGLRKSMEGIDTCVHLAGDASPSATWDSLLSVNIVGTYNVFVAAKAAKCRRVIYASSIHAVSGYPADVQVKPNEPVNPGDLYGVSKCFGEALCRYMAEQEGLSGIVLRIGAFQPLETPQSGGGIPIMDAFVSQRDLAQLISRCIDAQNLKFAIFHGMSDNAFKRLDISNARELVGYAPQDDFTQLNPKLKSLHLDSVLSGHNAHDTNQKSGLRDDLAKIKN